MAPRRSKTSRPPTPTQTLLLDNGSDTLKAGLIPSDVTLASLPSLVFAPRIIPNTFARDRHKKIYVGSELSTIRDYSELAFRRPMEKGFIVNWDVQKEIWDREIINGGKTGLQVDPSDTMLVFGEAVGGLPVLQSHCDQIVFEEYGFARYFRSPTPTWLAWSDTQQLHTPPHSSVPLPSEILLAIDIGYSHTTITPLLCGRPLHSAIRRLDIGGKLLTNYLARLLSVRHYDMRSDTAIVNEIKERACFVARDFNEALELCWKGPQGARNANWESGSWGIAKEYVLPDFYERMHGMVREFDPALNSKVGPSGSGSGSGEDVIVLRNERFAVPEVLFNPGDIGMEASGLAELVMESLRSLPVGLWPGLLMNVVVSGGGSLFEGLPERLGKELVELAPTECMVRVVRGGDGMTAGWWGGAGLVASGELEKVAVTKTDYEEYGAGWVARRMAEGLNVV